MWLRTCAVPPRSTPSCTAPILTRNLAFVRSAGLPSRSRVSGIASSPTRHETKPELPLREAPGSLSIDLNLDHEPRELLSSARSHETSLSSLTAAPVTNCHSSRPNYTGTLQCHSTSERVNFRDRSSDGSDRGSRSSGCLVMVVVLLFALLGRCVAQRSTGRRGFGGFRSRCASPRALRWSARPVR